jgi:hypothetical protein
VQRLGAAADRQAGHQQVDHVPYSGSAQDAGCPGSVLPESVSAQTHDVQQVKPRVALSSSPRTVASAQ